MHIRLGSSSLRRISLSLLTVVVVSLPVSAEEHRTASGVAPRLQSIVDSLRTRLDIPASVEVFVVQRNALMMSVEAPVADGAAFRLSVEEAALGELTDSELEAALAHELGHVWVFTHHPYLQTEQLANDVAMRVVARATLARLYDKVWRRYGTRGTDDRFTDAALASTSIERAHAGQ